MSADQDQAISDNVGGAQQESVSTEAASSAPLYDDNDGEERGEYDRATSMKKARDLKQDGNKHFSAKDFSAASDFYSQAILSLEDVKKKDIEAATPAPAPRPTIPSVADAEAATENIIKDFDASLSLTPSVSVEDVWSAEERMLLAQCYANRGACSAHHGDNDAVIEDSKRAIQLEGTYTKARVRKAQAHEAKEAYGDALEEWSQVLTISPNHQQAIAAKRRLPPLVAEEEERMKTEMMGKLKDMGNSLLGHFGLSTDNFKFEKDPNTGSYNIGFQQ